MKLKIQPLSSLATSRPPVSGGQWGGAGQSYGQHWARGALPFGASLAALNTSLYHSHGCSSQGAPNSKHAACVHQGARGLGLPGIRTRASSQHRGHLLTLGSLPGSAGDQGLLPPHAPWPSSGCLPLLHHVHPARGPGHTHHTPPRGGETQTQPLWPELGARDRHPRRLFQPSPKGGRTAAARNPDSGRPARGLLADQEGEEVTPEEEWALVGALCPVPPPRHQRQDSMASLKVAA